MRIGNACAIIVNQPSLPFHLLRLAHVETILQQRTPHKFYYLSAQNTLPQATVGFLWFQLTLARPTFTAGNNDITWATEIATTTTTYSSSTGDINSDRIALGVGIGIGVPSVVVGIAAAYFAWKSQVLQKLGVRRRLPIMP